MKLIEFAKMSGISRIISPYISQRAIPVAITRYMGSERLSVRRLLQLLTACGRNAKVVMAAAAKPIKVIKFIRRYFTRFSLI